MTLNAAVARMFATQGPLALGFAGFHPRSGQTRMALAVADTLTQGGALVVEAGTGVGKTFAYLVPALLSGKRVLFSTATKALQDQLFTRDIPQLREVLNVPVQVALLKGRGSYLCLQRLGNARQDARAMNPESMRHLAQLESWAATTRTGDLAELPVLDENATVIPLVTSTRDNCLGQRCPQWHGCHVNLARRQALSADVVVVNHHLFFADLLVRESGVAELLPTVSSVIFDEAHHINDIGVQFLGQQLSTGQLSAFGRDLALQGPRWARGLGAWGLTVLDIDRLVLAMRQMFGQGGYAARRVWSGASPQGIAVMAWSGLMQELSRVLEGAQAALLPVAPVAPELQGLLDRAGVLLAKIAAFAQPVPITSVRWVEAGAQVRLVESPLDIGQAMRTQVMMHDQSQRSWVFTSATLGSDAKLTSFVDACGLDGAQVLQVESPFDYAAQAGLYIPPHMPRPNDPSHSISVAQLAAQVAAVMGGRTLVLTTSLRAMRTIGDFLRQHFSTVQGAEVLVQGQAPKRELLDRFSRGAGFGAILVASACFWEGVDVPGDALQVVIIDKLPFSPPDDPLVEARAAQMESAGKNAFKHLHLPQATIALKQGVGRLIRRETDRGLLVVCDVRLTQMGYGRSMVAALPPMQRIANEEQFQEALRLLTKPSTRGPCWA